MNKGLKQVRKSIAKRNKLRSLQSRSILSKQSMQSLPQIEEKHGFYPQIQDHSPRNKQNMKLFGPMIVKGILSVALFIVVTFLLQSNVQFLEEPRNWTSQALTEEFPFARVNQWYQETFGSPLSFSPQNKQIVDHVEEPALSVLGTVTESFQANGSGIMISPDVPSPVSVWRDGMSIFAGNDHDTHKTIVVQHADRSKTTYGLLSSIDVHLYQFISQNQRIGTFNPTEENKSVYFSIEKNQEYIDPVQVIKVDDLP